MKRNENVAWERESRVWWPVFCMLLYVLPFARLPVYLPVRMPRLLL
jgi:hypothetical protein